MLLRASEGVNLDTDSIRTLLKKQVPSWWIPEAIVLVDTIPHATTGKIDKKHLRATYSHWHYNDSGNIVVSENK